MSWLEPRPYRDAADFEQMKTLLIAGHQAQNGTYYIHVGDIQWWLFYPDRSHEFGECLWLWEQNDQVLGWCLLIPKENAYEMFVHPSLRGTAQAEAMEAWTEARVTEQIKALEGQHVSTSSIAETDAVRNASLVRRGFSVNAYTLNYYVRSLDAIAAPRLPESYLIRATTGEPELEERALASHAAFSSKWPMDRYLERRRGFMRSPVFQAERDRVVATPEGRIASFCIYWLDPVSKVGLFEPVGTHPDFQGQGLSKALLLDTLQRMKAEGMETAIVCAVANNPAANALYRSVGFTLADRLLSYQKEI